MTGQEPVLHVVCLGCGNTMCGAELESISDDELPDAAPCVACFETMDRGNS